jgi:hypothetical protein
VAVTARRDAYPGSQLACYHSAALKNNGCSLALFRRSSLQGSRTAKRNLQPSVTRDGLVCVCRYIVRIYNNGNKTEKVSTRVHSLCWR